MSENSRIFLKLTSPKSGQVKGECTVDGYEDWIELDSWDWRLNRAKEEDAVPEPSVLAVTKLMDRSTTAMLTAMLAGEKLTAEIVVDDASEDLPFELKIELKDLTITDYKFGTQIGEKGGTVDEDWTFDYSKITFHHQGHDGSGTRSAPLERLPGASRETPAAGKKAEFRKLVGEMLAADIGAQDLKELWEQIVKAHESEKNRPEGKPLAHAGEDKRKGGD